MSEEQIIERDSAKLTALALVSQARDLIVVNQETLTIANDRLIAIKTLRRNFDNEFNPGISRAHELHKSLVAQKKKWTDKLDEAEQELKPKITAYIVERDRIRLEAERTAERARLQVEKEAQDAADLATSLIKNGKAAEADDIIDSAYAKVREIQADTPFVPDKPIANGISVRETWDFEIMDATIIPRTFLIPDLTMIRRYGQNMKHQATVPGIRFFSVKSIASRIGR